MDTGMDSRPSFETRALESASALPEGDTVLTMVSDDNFSMIQRTLLLQFKLVE
jgi:hypothetical protein